jgi:hypothetical protein
VRSLTAGVDTDAVVEYEVVGDALASADCVCVGFGREWEKAARHTKLHQHFTNEYEEERA